LRRLPAGNSAYVRFGRASFGKPNEVPTIEPHDDKGVEQIEAQVRDNNKSMAAMSGRGHAGRFAIPGWVPERNRAARSFRQLRRFHHLINSDKVFGTHSRVRATTGCCLGFNARLPVLGQSGCLFLKINRIDAPREKPRHNGRSRECFDARIQNSDGAAD
jgi:hypothetical protein